MIHVGILIIAVHQLVLRLVIAKTVIPDRVLLVVARQLGALSRLRITAVEKAITMPGGTAKLHPTEAVGQLLAGSDFHHPKLLPVTAGIRAGDRHVFIVFGKVHQRDGRRAVLGERIGVDKHLRLTLKSLLIIDNRLVLQTVIFGKKVVVARPFRCRIARIVDELRDPVFDCLPEGNLLKVAKSHFVLLINPGSYLGSSINFEPAIRITDHRAVVVV